MRIVLRPPRRREVLLTSAALALASLPLLRSNWLNFGATDTEIDAELPGDHHIPRPDLVATRAVGINAAPEQVWPWLLQMGADRGGFYSYDWVENILGSPVQSSYRINPDWQRLQTGDLLQIHPQIAFTVTDLITNRALVLRSPETDPFDMTWAFVLRRNHHRTTRLIIRERYRYPHPLTALVAEPVAAMSFVMTEKMMRGIRSRAGQRP